MEYTTKYRLSKPTYDDDVDIQVLNNNMDIIDSKLQSVSVVDNTLHVDDKSYPLNFLPLAGGNITGELTVQDKAVVTIIDKIIGENQTSIKYSDGTLIQYGTIDNPSTTNFKIPFTFQIPFINDKYIVFTANDGDRLYPDGTTFNTSFDHPCWVYRMNKTTTSCLVAGDDYAQGINVLAIGRWK